MGADAGSQQRILLGIEGMHCAACVARVERALARDATEVRVNLAARMAEIAWDPARSTQERIVAALEKAGFRPQLRHDDAELAARLRARRAELARLGVSLILSMQVMMLAWPFYFADAPTEPALVALLRWSQWLLATPVVLYGGWPFFRNAAQALAQRSINMDVPVALALAIAYLASAWRTVAGSGEIWFDSATMFVLLLGAGRYLEGRTREQATARMRQLASTQPLTARRVDGAGVIEVPIALLAAGDSVQVRSGEAAPVDGALLDAAAELDESLLTGESQPVRRERGERVLAGSLNVGAQALLLRAERLGDDTHLSHIARLLNRAQAQRPHFQQLADRLASGFIVAVMALAALGAWLALDRGADQALAVALSVLVASCPCALSLAMPAAVAAASSRLAANGALLANPAVLAQLRDANTVLFDKTGTLTRPGLAVTVVRTLGARDTEACLAMAAALERDSTHPIARAFAVGTALRYARSAGYSGQASAATDITREAGRGVSGTVDGARCWLGAPEFAPAPVVTGEADSTLGLSWIALFEGRQPLALFGLSAPVRPEAAAVVRELRQRGCAVELLTGDAPQAAYALARRVDITEVHVRQSAEDKLARLRALQAEGRVVIAVGDGINDAPFLGGADVAVAMPAGAALAQARADVILLGDSLAPLPLLLDLSRRAMRIARQNLAWALAYNLAVLPLAMAGALAPWMAALGMSLSSLLVVLNALRLGGGVTRGPAVPPAPEPAVAH